MIGFTAEIEKIENRTIRENLKTIADVLEDYITSEIKIDEDFLTEVTENIDNDEIKNSIENIRKQSIMDENNVIESFICSLKQNRIQYLNMDNSREFNDRSIKVKKMLYSYVNVSRALLSYDDYKNLIKNVPSNKKVLLIMGTVNPLKDTIMVLDEIDNVLKKSNLKQLYTIIPIYGCNTNQFREFLNRFEVDIVHLAGHGGKHNNGKYVVQFVDSNMTYPTIQKYIGIGKNLAFFNCCYSYELVMNKTSCANYMCVHQGPLNSQTACDFSSLFYDRLYICQDVNNSFNDAKYNTLYSQRYELIQ